MINNTKYQLLQSDDGYSWKHGGFSGNWKDTYAAMKHAKELDPNTTYHLMEI